MTGGERGAEATSAAQPARHGEQGVGTPAACVLCGSVPAADVVLRQGQGFLLVRRVRYFEGPYCRGCGLATFRRATNHTLVAGWWSPTSVVTNVFAVLANLAARRRLDRLGPPAGGGGPDTPLPAPLDPGRPLLLRVGPWLTGCLVALAVAVVAVGVTSGPRRDATGAVVEAGRLDVADLRVGDCMTLPETDEVVRIAVVPCGEEHNAEVFGVGTVPLGDAFEALEDLHADIVASACLSAFEEYAAGSAAPATLDFAAFYPTVEAWEAGDHDYQCYLFDPGGSLRGSLVERRQPGGR